MQIDVTISDSGGSPHFNVTVSVKVSIELVNDIPPEISLMVSGVCEADAEGDALALFIDRQIGKHKKRDTEESKSVSKREVYV